jgi:hypothetical protein
MAETVFIAEESAPGTGYRFSWGLAIVGGVVATAVTFFLLTLGAGFGLLFARPLPGAVPVFLTGGAIYFFVAQAFGFAIGGHFTGRLIGALPESPAQEEFRAEAHGFVAWAVAVLATVTLVAAAGTTAGTAALYGMAAGKDVPPAPAAYIVDELFSPNAAAGEGPRAEAGRIVDMGLVRGEAVAPADRGRLTALVASQAGLSRNAAEARIHTVEDEVRARTRHAADIARRAASYASLWIAVSLLFGAFVSMSAAVLARREDDEDALRRR